MQLKMSHLSEELSKTQQDRNTTAKTLLEYKEKLNINANNDKETKIINFLIIL
jgi:hypothetical protein